MNTHETMSVKIRKVNDNEVVVEIIVNNGRAVFRINNRGKVFIDEIMNFAITIESYPQQFKEGIRRAAGEEMPGITWEDARRELLILLKDKEANSADKAVGIDEIMDDIQLGARRYGLLSKALRIYGPRQFRKRLALLLETLRKRGYVAKVKNDVTRYYITRLSGE